MAVGIWAAFIVGKRTVCPCTVESPIAGGKPTWRELLRPGRIRAGLAGSMRKALS
ncbi:hypothetical protein MesoLj113c_46490 [Mesorhizobium sp. 113-3-9]|nr:hypothetical protein MesoLj113c_46490 [Mesorhizobium sp. 113-3-9]